MELKHIGRYDIKSLIGQGGMSAVYLGYDPRALREVAIKVLPPYFLHAEKFRERFEREALTIALLEHPAIVPVYDMGEEDGQPYIVMRYMSGGSLSDKLKNGHIAPKECVEMFIRLAPALDTAHARGVIHRDVKPDNLLFDKYNNVFLSDFGLARLRETLGFANISDGSIMGTPAYMSPEQIQGDREIDGRTDIYSMGVVLYQMLCGSVPFSGTTAASVMMMHLINTVPQIHEQNKTLPTAIQTVLDIAMAKNPNDRYQTAGEFAKALQAVMTIGLNKQPTKTIRPGDTTQTRKRPTLIIPPKKPGVQKDQPNGIDAKREPDSGNKTPVSLKPLKDAATAAPLKDDLFLPTSTSRPDSSPHQRRIFPVWVWLLGGALVIILSLALIQWARGGFPLSLLPASSPNPIGVITESSPVATSSLASITAGHADKVAFLNASDIWVSDLDGRYLTQLTSGAVKKSNLRWTPDGQSVSYTSANCLYLVGLQTKQVLTLACFSGVASIDAFDISPNGQNIALVLDQSDLYIFPYSQLFRLQPASRPEDLSSLSLCPYHAPFHLSDGIKAVHWSANNDRLAVLFSKPIAGTDRDEINILDFSQCEPTPLLEKEILSTYFLFSLRGYYDHPEIPGFSWNGNDRLLLNGYQNNAGFGDLLLYNLDQNQGQSITRKDHAAIAIQLESRWLLYLLRPSAGSRRSNQPVLCPLWRGYPIRFDFESPPPACGFLCRSTAFSSANAAESSVKYHKSLRRYTSAGFNSLVLI
jgi:serine/threonine protein kinase